MARMRARSPQSVTSTPTLSFRPTATKIAYLKGRGSVYHEEDLASESNFEIHYWDGNAHRYVMDVFNRGSNARMPILTFDPKGERIFFMESKPAQGVANTYLSSVKLSGDDYRQHIESKYAAEIVPSPDSKWVAFKELHKLYVAPFPQTGKIAEADGD